MAEPALANHMIARLPVHLHRTPQPVLGVALSDAGVSDDSPEPERMQRMIKLAAYRPDTDSYAAGKKAIGQSVKALLVTLTPRY